MVEEAIHTVALGTSRPDLSEPVDRHATGTRVERVLAVGRAFLTVMGLVTIYIDPTQPERLVGIPYAILAAYALYSVGVLIYAHGASRIEASHAMAFHCIDIVLAAVLTFVGDGQGSPFFLFFLFSVVSSAYRWGFLGTIATTATTIAVYLLQTGVAEIGPWSQTWFATFDLQLSRTILRVLYLSLTGFLLGYLAEQEKRSRDELIVTADVSRQPRVDLGLGGSVTAVGRKLLTVFRAGSAVVIIRDRDTRGSHLWRIEANAKAEAVPRRDLAPDEQAAWLFDAPGPVWECSPDAEPDRFRARVVVPGFWPLRRTRVEVPSLVQAAIAGKRVLIADIGWADEWDGRVYLLDAATRQSPEEALHFLGSLTSYMVPALTNVLLTNQLRNRASAAERARVARELHDGSIQSLIGLEMKLQALRRTASVPGAIAVELERAQNLVRQEVLELRELMQALRPIELDASERLPDVLADLVERFRRDTGLAARFVFSGRSVSVPPPMALEVVRIVQEALVNVRKHSRARNVLVRLSSTASGCILVVEDDGVGLSFEGRLSGEDLDRSRAAPAMLRERARLAGAHLSIDSTPGSGTRIELNIGVPV